MKCNQAKPLFSSYLDGAMTGAQMHAFSQHLDACVACHREYLSLRQVQQVMAMMGPAKASADLALRLRVAISREIARTSPSHWAGLLVRLENTVNAFMVPAITGLATAVLIFGVLMGVVALPLQSASADVPLPLTSGPQLQHSGFDILDSIHADSLVIEAVVDSKGRVQDYRVLSSPQASPDLSPEVKNMLIFTTFRPARSVGQPTSGRAVLSFSRVSVKG